MVSLEGRNHCLCTFLFSKKLVIRHGNEVKSQQLEHIWDIVKSNTGLNGIRIKSSFKQK